MDIWVSGLNQLSTKQSISQEILPFESEYIRQVPTGRNVLQLECWITRQETSKRYRMLCRSAG